MRVSAPPTDPLGSVAQDPEAVRTEACRLTASDATCATVAVATTEPNATDGSAGAAGLNLATLALWFALIAGLVVLLVVIGRALARRGATIDDAEDAPDDAAEELPGVIVDRRREPTNWRAEADAHRRARRYRDALRCRYRALVGDLARRGLIDEIPGRTTGEERSQLRDVAPRAAPPFDRAADLFDGAWYGAAPVGEGDDDAFIELEREVLSGGPST
jgi:hypothetical protein